jgi:phosphoribosylformylglycinamidine synthase
MPHRIEVTSQETDPRAASLLQSLQENGWNIPHLEISDIYTIDADISQKQIDHLGSLLANPVSQQYAIDSPQQKKPFAYAVEIGFLPGVTDNVGSTVKEMIHDALSTKSVAKIDAYSSVLYFFSGNLTKKEIGQIAATLHNPLIQQVQIKSYDQFQKENGMDMVIPCVILASSDEVTQIDLDISDEELTTLGKKGIQNSDGTRRGPLALRIEYMKTIQEYFRRQKRNPTDIELESLAQTWSEHCKHTIFSDPIDELKDGLYRTYIKGATKKICKQKGAKDFCVSVFTDNAGGIIFDNEYLVTHKVETHNSPSALDPFGGALTGIVGVNRDAMGFGMGAKPVVNVYGFCVGKPDDTDTLYRDKELTQPMLSPKRVLDGVVAGVRAGGNQSGIPCPQGFVEVHDRYKGKPLVFAGTVGLIPRTVNGKPGHEKQAQPGDYVVMVGGRVGKDGIHGATFSSEALDSGSPATAVQIGDPITQKKMSDALVKEARDRGLYNSITDNGAGGLSCSVSEMAKECGGCEVDLDQVPLKYPGLTPWEIWISESQERMTLAVLPEKWEELHDLLKKRGVEATVIGQFTNSGHCVVRYNKETILDLEMNFLHDGLPKIHQKTKKPALTPFAKSNSPATTTSTPASDDLTTDFLSVLSHPSLSSSHAISQQYDHTVQGGCALGPLQGKGLVNGDASIIRPVLGSQKGVILSQSLYPTYTDLDPYAMAASTIDTTIRNIVCAGGDPDTIALLDNFCWCDSYNPERLWQLKQAAQACYDYAVAYGTPYISGKDSMFNDFKGFDSKGKPVSISVPPTLLISSIGVMEDVTKAVSIDLKQPGDLLYLIGETHHELAGSVYHDIQKEKNETYENETGIPQIDAEKNKLTYDRFFSCVKQELISSAISIHRGGIAYALTRTAMAGRLGIDADLSSLPGTANDTQTRLFSESQGRMLVSVSPKNTKGFEKQMKDTACVQIGKVRKDEKIIVTNENEKVIRTSVEECLKKYKSKN